MNARHSILDRIVENKREKLARLREAVPLQAMDRFARSMAPPRSLRRALAGPGVSVMAEIKPASPSLGTLAPGLDPVALAQAYEDAGCAAVSYLTEEDHFLGRPELLDVARRAVSVPVLRKDFLLAPYQVYESRVLGADAVLLIVALLGHGQLRALLATAANLGMDALVEVHTAEELDRALAAGASMVGVNNRDLKTLTVDFEASEALLPRIPQGVVRVVESGIRSPDDLDRAAALGAHAVLVGTALVTAADPGLALRRLRRDAP